MHSKHRRTFAFDGIDAIDRLGRRRVGGQAAGDAPIVLLDIRENDLDALRCAAAGADEGVGHRLGEGALLLAGAAGKQFHSDDGHWQLLWTIQPNTLAGARKWHITSSAKRCIISSVSAALCP